MCYLSIGSMTCDKSAYRLDATRKKRGAYMDLDSLSDLDKGIVGQALRAAANGPFFPDWEFHTLFGLERDRVREIADAWPKQVAPPEEMTVAVNNSLNNLLGYPHG